MKPVRVGLVGCGKVGPIHAAALGALPESEFVAACDAMPERAASFAAKYGVRPFTDLARCSREVEAVVIGTPHPLHAEPAIRAAEAGVHVLVEKPLAATLADCDAMLAAARKSGVTLGVISQRRFYEPVLRMKAAIDAGKIGRPVLGVFQMYSWRDPAYYQSDPWRGKWDTEGGGVLVNQSPHQLDLLLWLMGPAVEVSGYWANLNHPTVEVEDTAVATIRFKSGGLGLDRHQPVAEAGTLHEGPHPRLERGIGRRRDRPRADVHRRRLHDRRTAAQRPLDDPGRGIAARGVPGRGPRAVRFTRRHNALPRATDPRLPPGDSRRPPAARYRRGRPRRRGTLHGHLSFWTRGPPDPNRLIALIRPLVAGMPLDRLQPSGVRDGTASTARE